MVRDDIQYSYITDEFTGFMNILNRNKGKISPRYRKELIHRYMRLANRVICVGDYVFKERAFFSAPVADIIIDYRHENPNNFRYYQLAKVIYIGSDYIVLNFNIRMGPHAVEEYNGTAITRREVDIYERNDK